jgi:putative membrane protein
MVTKTVLKNLLLNHSNHQKGKKMNLLHRSFTKKLTNLIGIVGVSAVIAVTAVTGYSHFNHPAVAQTPPVSPSRPTTPNTRISELDRLYVTEAGQGGMAEVQMAQLALRKSKNENVKRYAQQMIREHTPVNQELMDLATRKGITPPTDVGPKYQAAIARLSQLSSKEFDQAYQQEAGLNLHQEYLVVQRRQSQLGQDSDLRAFATKNIPVAQEHLQMAENLLNP